MLLNVHGKWINTEKPGGQVFFVGGGTVAYEGQGASNVNDGLTPKHPLSTIAQGLTQSVSGRGDTVVLLPGSVTVTAAINVTIDDVTIMGYHDPGPWGRSSSVIVNATDVNTFTINANDVELRGLTLDDNVATATAATAAIAINTGNDGVDFTGTRIINCYVDMAGADTDRNGITVGLTADANDGGLNTLIEGCVVYDCEQDAIHINLGSENSIVRNCLIYDDGTRLTRYGVEVLAVTCLVQDCTIQVSDTATPGACVHNGVAAARLQVHRCNLAATGANTIGILAIATATQFTSGNSIVAVAAGNLIDYTTDNTSPSTDVGFSGIFAATPGAGVFVTPTVDGT